MAGQDAFDIAVVAGKRLLDRCGGLAHQRRQMVSQRLSAGELLALVAIGIALSGVDISRGCHGSP